MNAPDVAGPIEYDLRSRGGVDKNPGNIEREMDEYSTLLSRFDSVLDSLELRINQILMDQYDDKDPGLAQPSSPKSSLANTLNDCNNSFSRKVSRLGSIIDRVDL